MKKQEFRTKYISVIIATFVMFFVFMICLEAVLSLKMSTIPPPSSHIPDPHYFFDCIASILISLFLTYRSRKYKPITITNAGFSIDGLMNSLIETKWSDIEYIQILNLLLIQILRIKKINTNKQIYVEYLSYTNKELKQALTPHVQVR